MWKVTCEQRLEGSDQIHQEAIGVCLGEGTPNAKLEELLEWPGGQCGWIGVNKWTIIIKDLVETVGTVYMNGSIEKYKIFKCILILYH